MDDYQDASKRHLDDAELLFTQATPHLANASHLYGISAECSLKAIARKNNSAARFGGSKGHIPNLFNELANIAPAIAGNVALANSIHSIQSSFSNWLVEQRYHAQTNFSAATIAKEQNGAKNAHLLMNNYLQGLI